MAKFALGETVEVEVLKTTGVVIGLPDDKAGISQYKIRLHGDNFTQETDSIESLFNGCELKKVFF